MIKLLIKARKVNKDRSMEEPIIIAEMDGSRSSGFPQMEKLGDYVFFAWTYLQEDESTIKMKKWKVN